MTTSIDELQQAERAAAQAVQAAQEHLTFEQTAGAENARSLVRNVLERAAAGEQLDTASADGHARGHLLQVARLTIELADAQTAHERARIAVADETHRAASAQRLAARGAMEEARREITAAEHKLSTAERDADVAHHEGERQRELRQRSEARITEIAAEREAAVEATTNALIGGGV